MTWSSTGERSFWRPDLMAIGRSPGITWRRRVPRSITLPVSPELGRPEHDEWRWVDRETALSLVATRLQPIVSWAAEAVDMG